MLLFYLGWVSLLFFFFFFFKFLLSCQEKEKLFALLLLLLGYYWQERNKQRKFAMKFDCWSSLKRKLYEEAGVMSENDLALSCRVLLLIHADCIDRQVKARPS